MIVHLFHLILGPVNDGILCYFLAVNSSYAILVAAATVDILVYERQSRHIGRLSASAAIAPSISLIAAAYNEATTIESSILAFLSLDYPDLEVIIVNDGSTDQTLNILKERFDLVEIHNIFWRRVPSKTVHAVYRSRRYHNLLVADKLNGGRADGVNAGINLATKDLVCTTDADTLIEQDALRRMARQFVISPALVAVGGTIRVANGCTVRRGHVVRARVPHTIPAGFQVVEYLRAFLYGRLGWNRTGGNLIISGAFGLFRRDAVVAVGGYTSGSLAEDLDLIVRLRRRGSEKGGPQGVSFIPDPVAWTEVPPTLKSLGSQRRRWHQGLAETLWRHRAVLFNYRYGIMGFTVFPYYVFAELLSPIVEVLGLLLIALGLALNAVNLSSAIAFFLAAYVYSMILTGVTLIMDELNYQRYNSWSDRGLLLLWMLLENFGYRQLTVFWRLGGLIRWARGQREWGAMERQGFAPAATPASDLDRVSRAS